MDLTKIGKRLTDNLPSILSGAAMIGVVETTILAVKVTPKADHDITEATIYTIAHERRELTLPEKIGLVYKYYIPSVSVGVATIGCIFAANYMHLSKEAGLMVTARLFESRYNQYREKNRQINGAENDRQIERNIDHDQMENNPPPSYLEKFAKDESKFLCYEPFTKQYFVASKQQLMWAEMTINKILQQEAKVTLNQLLKLLPGVDAKRPEGNNVGWYLDNSYYEFIGYNWGFYGSPWVDFQPEFDKVNGKDVLVVKFNIAPERENMWSLDDIDAIKDSQEEQGL